jgi:ketosteroid isomerase-like protein
MSTSCSPRTHAILGFATLLQRFFLALGCMAIFAPWTAHADNPSDLAAFKAAIRAKYDLKEAAFRAHDPLPIVNQFYSEDVVSVGPGEGYTRGRKDLLEVYKKHMTSMVRIVSVLTHVKGDSGLDWANFYITPDDKNEKPFSFKILFLWEKRDGKWWCIGDYFSRGQFPDETTKAN